MSKPVIPYWNKEGLNMFEPDDAHKNKGWLITNGIPEKPSLLYMNYWMKKVAENLEYHTELEDRIENIENKFTELENRINYIYEMEMAKRVYSHLDLKTIPDDTWTSIASLRINKADISNLNNVGFGGLFTGTANSKNCSVYSLRIKIDESILYFNPAGSLAMVNDEVNQRILYWQTTMPVDTDVHLEGWVEGGNNSGGFDHILFKFQPGYLKDK